MSQRSVAASVVYSIHVRQALFLFSSLWALSVLTACGNPAEHADAAGTDGPHTDVANDMIAPDAPDSSRMCTTDNDCADGMFCNGVERCASGAANADARGCTPASPATPCIATQTCDESMSRCISSCPHAPDADGDGHRSTDCGGDDCDDADANRFPGNPEVCDANNHDEDCDARTFGFRDVDMDGFVDAQCCNAASGGMMTCGDDCNDSRPNVHPGLVEACDGLDNDCNGSIDEGLSRLFFLDLDGDGYGESATSADAGVSDGGQPIAVMRCAPGGGYVDTAGDCDDANSAVHPGAVELCDAMMLDENCDGTANPASLCTCSGDVSQPCMQRGACAAGTQRCVGGGWGACSIMPVTEVCNGVDDDCNGTVDDGLVVTCYPDLDNDGYAAAGATSVQSCPIPGRELFAGCPSNQTNRAPMDALSIDCNDTLSTISPGEHELCDAARVDEDCDGVANPAALCSCTDGQTRPCVASGSCGAGNQTCVAGRWGACSVNPLPESCNGVDDNCNGMTDEGLTVTCYADNDNDGFAAMGSAPIESCPVMGRTYVGGCPTGQTNVPPAPAAGGSPNTVDCNDMNAAVNPSAVEQCDAAMVDENCDGAANPSAQCQCSGTSSRPCPQSGVCAAGTQTCNSGSWGLCSILPVSEICNGIDDNCNGTVDESLTIACFVDTDNDGYAAATASVVMRCPDSSRAAVGGCPAGTTNRAPGAGVTDCNDSNAGVNPAATEVCDASMVDENCDGSANPSSLCACSGSGTRACALPGPCAAGSQMCVSGQWSACSISPVAESCNGIDDNCNGMSDEGLTVTCYADNDNDGYAASGAPSSQRCPDSTRGAVGGCPSGFTNRAPTTGNTDCDDTNAARSPGAAEVCNGVDDNCNAMTDEGATVTCYGDADNDGFAPVSSAAAQRCPDTTRTAVGSCPVSYTNRAPGSGTTDCNDTNPTINPLATEVCDGAMVDENCDGMANPASLCACSGSTTRPCPLPGACAAGTQTCNSGQFSACSVSPIAEVCNGVDDNCNGTTDEGLTVMCYADVDNDGYPAAGAMSSTRCADSTRPAVGGCPTGYTNRAPGAGTIDCNDANVAVNPGVVETCDGVDNNCNGMIDESLTLSCYTDNDNDTYAASGSSPSSACPNSSRAAWGGCPVGLTNRAPTSGAIDCNDSSSTINPATPETCNGVDDNCNGSIDEGVSIVCYNDADDDGYPPAGATAQPPVCPQPGRGTVGGCPFRQTNRAPTAGNIDCNDLLASIHPGATELCNGVDDDCNATVDDPAVADSACSVPNAVSGCRAGACVTLACNSGYGDCDGVRETGCEVALNTNSDCGACGVSCSARGTCQSGRCDRIVQLVSGWYFSCALRSSGTVNCWGRNFGGALGNGDSMLTDQYLPVLSAGAYSDFVQIAAGQFHACGRRSNGAVICWGYNAGGQIGDGTTTDRVTPVAVTGLDGSTSASRATDITCGSSFSCAVVATGQVRCWGTNSNGQLGDGTMVDHFTPTTTASGITTAVEVKGAATSACARLASGAVQCWGYNGFGQLGNNSTTQSASPVNVMGISTAVQLAAQQTTMCARLASGAVQCWGADSQGSCGDATGSAATPSSRPVPVTVAGLNGTVGQQATSIGSSPAGQHACAVVADNPTWSGSSPVTNTLCWGSNTLWQLGNGSRNLTNSPYIPEAPLRPIGLYDGAQPAPGGETTCVLRYSGDVACWGTGAYGRLGDGTTVDHFTAGPVNGLDNASIVEIDNGAGFGCIRRANGLVQCWGGGNQLGDGSSASVVRARMGAPASGINDALELATGTSHACVRRIGGQISCWGDNSYGQFGVSSVTTPSSSSPVNGPTYADATMLTGGSSHTCVRRSNGEVWCWGGNNTGQLGNNTTTASIAPVRVLTGASTALADALRVDASGNETCVQRTTGQVACWGDNSSGGIGDGTTAGPRTMALTIASPNDFIDVAVSEGGSACARRAGGTVYCWGANYYGQLGDGTNMDRATPGPSRMLDAAYLAHTSGDHECVIRTNGNVACWGGGFAGQIGDGASVSRALPTTISFAATRLGAGYNGTCALNANGIEYCWGAAANGQLGNGSLTNASTPQAVLATP